MPVLVHRARHWHSVEREHGQSGADCSDLDRHEHDVLGCPRAVHSKDLAQFLEIETSLTGNLTTRLIICELTLRCSSSRFGSTGVATSVDETNERGAGYGPIHYEAQPIRKRPDIHTSTVATEGGSSRDLLGAALGASSC